MRFVQGAIFAVITALVPTGRPVAHAAPPAGTHTARRPGRGASPTLALVELGTVGIDREFAGRVQRQLRGILEGFSGYRLLSPRTVRKRLARGKVEEGAPVSRMLGALRVRYVVTGTLGGLGQEVSIDLKLLDGGSGEEIRRVGDNLPAAAAERNARLEELLVRLLVPDEWVGVLALDISEQGALVYLDGRQVATTPLDEPLVGLKPGKHILRITKEGFDEFSKFVLVRYNQVARLKVDMTNSMVVGLIYERKKPEVPSPAPVPRPASGPVSSGGDDTLRLVLAWSTLGLGAGAAGTGLFFLLERDNRVMAPVLITSGGVLLAGSLVLFLVGGGEPEAAGPAPPGSGWALVPAAVPGGMTLGLTGRF